MNNSVRDYLICSQIVSQILPACEFSIRQDLPPKEGQTEADWILFPILKSFNECGFQGTGSNDNETNDWRAWDGKPWGYEGLLVDNYLVVKAVLVRQGLVDPEWGFWIK